MSGKVIPMDEWLQVFRDAAKECSTTFRFDSGAELEARADAPQRPGAYIAILSEQNSVHLGLTATPSGCRALARGLLGMRTADSPSDKDVVDSVSEVINILAGKVKSRLNGRDGKLHLGLPMFISEPIRVTDGTESAAADVKIGPLDCRLTVYRRPRAA